MKINLLTLLCLASSIYVNAQITLPYSQDFEDATFPPAGWQTFSGTSGANWVRNTDVSGFGTGTACTSFDNFNTAAGNYYGIRLPSMDFTGVQNPYVRFDIAYAQRPAAASDNFTWYWSNNGTGNWASIQNYSGAALTSASSTANLFIPAANEWRTITLSLLSLINKSFVRLAIEDVCAHGNIIYFDNVSVFDSIATGIHKINVVDELQIHPSPFSSFITIASNGAHNLSKAELFNSTGALLVSAQQNNAALVMDNLTGLPGGIYFIRVYTEDGSVHHRKLVKL